MDTPPTSSTTGILAPLSRASNCSKMPAKSNAFGSSLVMNKEDHERERIRWLQKLEEAENRLAETEVINAEMNQIRAELNKRLVEMERNQRPLIDQNRRLAERNKLLQNEMKKAEQKASHIHDDFLSLKDSYEKLMKENSNLKEKRAFPEKLEELTRYKNQVLEYSKCITALRQAGVQSKSDTKDSSAETDRWIDLDCSKIVNGVSTDAVIRDLSVLKKEIFDLGRSANLMKEQRDTAAKVLAAIEHTEKITEETNQLHEKIANVESKNQELEVRNEKLREVGGKTTLDLYKIASEISDLQNECEIFRAHVKRELSSYFCAMEEVKTEINVKAVILKEKEAEIYKKVQKEKAELEQEVVRTSVLLKEAEEAIIKLKDDIRPAIKTDLERRFEESRFRLKEALEMKRDVDSENENLRTLIAELEAKLKSKDSLEEELQRVKKYTDQLEKQFSTQVTIIDALKSKVIQHKALGDFVAPLVNDGDLTNAQLDAKFDKFYCEQTDDAERQLTDNIRRLLWRLVEHERAKSSQPTNYPRNQAVDRQQSVAI